MTKSHKTSTALLLAAALLLSGCAEHDPASAPGAEISTSSDSLIGNSSSEPVSADSSSSEAESSNSSENTERSESSKSTENSSEPGAEKIPVEFTEEDKEFQEMLKPIAEGCDRLNTWYSCDAAYDSYQGGNLLFESIKFKFPELVDPYSQKVIEADYYQLPKDHKDAENALPIPNTYEDVKNTMLEYLTEQYVSESEYYGSNGCAKGTMSKNDGGGYNVILENKDFQFAPKLLEIDGVMYRQSGVGGRDAFTGIIPSTAKIVSKTDDTVEFTYLWNHWSMCEDNGDPKYIDDVKLYDQCACTGVLKYERGGWRRDKDKADS